MLLKMSDLRNITLKLIHRICLHSPWFSKHIVTTISLDFLSPSQSCCKIISIGAFISGRRRVPQDYFDVSEEIKNNQKRILENEIRFLVLSFTSDWLFPTKESREIVSLLNSIGSNVSFAEVVSDRGHDSFLLDEPQFFRVCEGFLRGIK